MGTITPIEATSAFFDSHVDDLVESWIAWLKKRVDGGVVQSLPRKAIENHIPPVVRALGRFLTNPSEVLRTDLLGHLRMHGSIRRDQGYALEEVLAEFDGLANILTEAVEHVITSECAEARAAEVAGVFTRMGTGLRSIALVAVETFNDSVEMKNQAVAARLEEFARAIVHELQNPLAAAKMANEVLQLSLEQDSQLYRQAELIDSSVERGLSLLGTIRLLAVTGAAWAGDKMTNLLTVVGALRREFSDACSEAGVTLDISSDLPSIRVESILAMTVLANLVANSIKYADGGKADRWVRLTTRLIEEEDDTGFCEITIEDNGIGIPRSMIPRVGQKGFRAHPSHSYGTGMGLYMVQQILAERGGELNIKSEEGKGTRVAVRFRYLTATAADTRADHTTAHLDSAPSVRDELGLGVAEDKNEG